MKLNIAVIKGDGIGPEIVDSALDVLHEVLNKHGHTLVKTELLAGGCAIDEAGVPLPKDTMDKCLMSDAVLLGAVGGPKWDSLPGHLRPERALLELRKNLGLFANLRPAKLYPELRSRCPLKNDSEFDMLVIRELTGGIYFGESGRSTSPSGTIAYDTESYSEAEIKRIGFKAFQSAENRRQKLTSIDKANVLESSRLWRETMHMLAQDFPHVEYSDMLVDNAAMQLIKDPTQFDVIVTSNMFGDILTDEVSQLTGSIGMLPSASIGESARGLYEPIHGSAPDIAGKDIANPLATILSIAMMLKLSFGLDKESIVIENSVKSVIEKGFLTFDLGGSFGTKAVTEKILENLNA